MRAPAAAYLRAKLPGVAVSASHEITREWREYERASTIVLNAYVQPIVSRYLDALERALRGRSIAAPLMAGSVQRRHHQLRLGQGASDHAAGIGAGGRRQRRRAGR